MFVLTDSELSHVYKGLKSKSPWNFCSRWKTVEEHCEDEKVSVSHFVIKQLHGA